MNENDIYTKLTNIFQDVFDDESLALTPQMTADDVEDWDSLTHVNLMVAVEKGFGVRFSTREVKNLRNVGDFVSLIGKKLLG